MGDSSKKLGDTNLSREVQATTPAPGGGEFWIPKTQTCGEISLFP